MRTRELVVALAVMAGCSPKAPQPEAAAAGPSTPAATAAPAVNARSPGGQLTQSSGAKIALADVLHRHAQTVVVFYRGFY